MGWTSTYILENERGERYDLTPPASVFLTNVQGLGASSNNSFAQLGGGFFALTRREEQQDPIIGDLVYQPNAFTNYKGLVDWLFSSTTLYFCYAPDEMEYRKRIALKSISKSPRDSAGWMRATVSFDVFTPWLLPTPTDVGIGAIEGTIKQFSAHNGDYYYEYTDDLVYGKDLGDYATQIPPVGHSSSGIVLRYRGVIQNPVFRLVGQNGTEYGACAIAGTFQANDVIELSTVQNDCHVLLFRGTTTTDLVRNGSVDLTRDPYFRAPSDEPSVLIIDADDVFSGKAELQVYSEWRTV